MKIETVNWKEWKCSSHLDSNEKIIITKWNTPGPQPTTAQIQQASDDYDVYLANKPAQDLADFAAVKAKLKNKLGITTQAEWRKFRKAIKWIAENLGD